MVAAEHHNTLVEDLQFASSALDVRFLTSVVNQAHTTNKRHNLHLKASQPSHQDWQETNQIPSLEEEESIEACLSLPDLDL